MQTRKTLSWIKEEITRSISVSLMIYIITGAYISNAYPIFAQQGYENPREATGRIVCANCHLANKPVGIEVPQAVLPDTVFEAVVRIPTICLIDTNCDPDLTDISIPANDDAIASIRLILNKLVFAICEGRSSYIRNP